MALYNCLGLIASGLN